MIGLGLSSRNASFFGLSDQEVIEQLLLENYSGAAAAYSLRKISGAYSGPAIRVLRDSDSSETDIGFDGDGNLDTTAIATFCGSNNGFVTRWYDQSGNGNDAIQTTPSSQPKIYDGTDGLVLENGKPAVEFDSDFLSSPNTDKFDELSVFFVAIKPNTQANSAFVSRLGDSSGSGEKKGDFHLRSDSAFIRTIAGDSDGSQYLYTEPNTRSVFSFLWDGSVQSAINTPLGNGEAVVRIDSNIVDQTATDGNFNSGTDQLRINATHTIANDVGRYQEIILYNSDQSSNRSGIETNIGSYYTTNSPLLDTYTGAAAAYSLRKLSDSYSGSAIRVRRDNDDQEQDIGFNLFEGLDTQALIDFCGSNNGFVTVLYDQSGNSIDLSQGTPSFQPKIHDSTNGVNMLNGKPAMAFVGDMVVTNTSISSTPSEYWASWVARRYTASEGTSGNRGLFDTFGNRMVFDTQISGWMYDGAYTGNPIDYNNEQRFVFLDLQTGSGNAKAYVNKELHDTDTFSERSITGDTRLGFGGSSFMIGDIQEFVIWTTNQSSNRAAVETNINDFYNVWGTFDFDLTPVDIAFVGALNEWTVAITGEFSRESSATDTQKYTTAMAVDGRDPSVAYSRLNLKTTVDLVDTSTQTTYTATGYIYTTAPETADGVITFRLSGQDVSSVSSFSDLNLTATDFTPNLPDLTPAGQLVTGWEGRVTLEADPASPVVINGSTYNASSNNDWDSQPSGAYQSFLVFTF